MLYFFIVILILLGTFNNTVSIFTGYSATPAYQVWLGTIHHPDDYFYYLSQFAQGKDSWGPAKNLYAHDFQTPTMVGWVNVWMGKIGSLIGLEPIQSYHAWVIVLTVILLSLVFSLFYYSVEKKSERLVVATVGLFFFVLNNSFSYPVRENGTIIWKTVEYWFNFGTPGQRLGGVPHHLLMHSVLAFLFLLIIVYVRSRIRDFRLLFMTLGFGLLGALLASIQPIHWVLGCCVAGLVGLQQIIRLVLQKKNSLSSMHRLFWPSLVLFISGILPAWELQRLFSKPPFSQLPTWEFANSVAVSFSTYLLATGPVLFLAVAGLLFLRKRLFQFPGFLLFIYVIISLGLFFSPLPSVVQLQNVRFLSSLTMAGLSFLAASGVIIALQGIKTFRLVGLVVVLVLFFLCTLPAHMMQLARVKSTGIGNAYIYVDRSVIEAMNQARALSEHDDVFAVMWPYHKSFPAITGRTVYYGHPLLTIDSEEKGKENYHFFSNIKSPSEQSAFLKREGIDYVVAEPWAIDAIQIPDLIRIFQNQALVIAKVNIQ